MPCREMLLFQNMGRMGRVGFLLPSRVPKGLVFLVCGVTFRELGMRLMFEDPSVIRGLVSRQGRGVKPVFVSMIGWGLVLCLFLSLGCIRLWFPQPHLAPPPDNSI